MLPAKVATLCRQRRAAPESQSLSYAYISPHHHRACVPQSAATATDTYTACWGASQAERAASSTPADRLPRARQVVPTQHTTYLLPLGR